MPNLGETQYYTRNINGEDVYTAVPWGGNALPTYTPISKDQYVSGLQTKLSAAQKLQGDIVTANQPFHPGITADNLQNFASSLYSPQWYQAYLQSNDMSQPVEVRNRAAGMMPYYTGSLPSNSTISALQQQLNEVQQAAGVHAPGYVDPSFSQFNPQGQPNESNYTDAAKAQLANIPKSLGGLGPETTENHVNAFSGAAGYAGPSIVDFLKAAGQPSDMATLQKLGAQYGIVNNAAQYTGTAGQNTQLLNILKGLASGNVSHLGIPTSISANAGTVPTPNTPINTNNLGSGNGPSLSSIAGVNIPTSVNSDIAGLLSLYGSSSADQKSYNDLTTKLTDLMGSMGNEAGDLQTAMDSQGVGAAYNQVKELNLRAAQLQGQLAQFDVSTQKGVADLGGQSIPTGLITGQQAQYQKQQDLQKLTMTSELSATLALSQAYQGNATLGLQLAQKAVDLKYQPIQNQIDVLKTQIGYAKDILTKEDTARTNIIDKLLTLKQNEITAQKEQATKVQTLAITAAGNGAPLSVVTAMQKAGDPVTAASIGNQYVGSKSTQGASGTNGTTKPIFSQANLNKGAANAGVSIADFKNLSDDSKNYYINSYTQFNTILKNVQTGKEDAKAVTDEINSSNLPQDVKNNLTTKLKPYLPKAGNSGFLGGVGNFFGSVYNGIKSFF